MRYVCLIVALLLAAPVAGYDWEPECGVSLLGGWHYVILNCHYEHAYPQPDGAQWVSSVGQWIEGPLIVGEGVRCQGHAIGKSWLIDFTWQVSCGEIPDPNAVFDDGFELGTTTRWHKSVGEI